MCIGGEALPSSLSVLRTLRSVWIGSSEPLRGIRLVCYMYYTDVFVGQDNIDKLKDALNAELKGSVNSNALTQLTALADGLGFLAGLPACLCKTKKSVKEGLGKIYKELKTSLISCLKSKLNCDSCSKDVPCKCCVIQSIKDVKKCPCRQSPKKDCHCNGSDVSCSKVLAGLEACLHLQCLQSDMNEICECKADSECCKSGKCDGNSVGSGQSCNFCQKLNAKTPVATTGLGLSPPNPIRLAGRLEGFFGSSGPKGSKNSCGCKGSPCTCCCLACESTDQCVQACSCKGSSGQCSCSSQHSPQGCPRKKFCKAIKDIKIAAESTDMTCCESGQKCHCQVEGSNCSGQNCCVVTSGGHSYHSLKCLIRRLVKFFNGLSLDSSNKNCSKICCEIFCVLKISYFLKDLFNASKSWAGKKSCGKCKGKGSGKNCPGSKAKTGSCCNGNPSQCVSSSNSDPTCCQGCPDCNAIKFRKALQTLRFAGPCGQELYRTLDDFLNFCCNVFWPQEDFIHSTAAEAVKDCSNCKKSETDSSGWKACKCSSSSSGSCTACPKLLGNSQLMSILRHGYVSSYVNSKWDSLCPKSSSSKCCCGRLSCSCSKSSSSSPCCKSLSSSPCNPKNCCDACPQRKAAKIFLGMLPCLYYGLKILHDRSKYGSGFAGWHDITMDSKGNPSSDLGKFLKAWGYDLRPLKSKNGSEFFPLLDSLSTPGV
ncbi:variant erythrocyte surface antigen-1, alpha subunit, partial [Babesia divergens]